MRRHPLAVGFLLLAAAGPVFAGPIVGRVSDADGRPVAGARVACYVDRAPEVILLERLTGADPEPIAESKTDANGRFSVASPRSHDAVSLRVFPERLPSVDAGPLDPSGDTEELNLLLPLAEPLAGRVLDDTGKPLSGALVIAAVDATSSEGDGAAFDETRTARDGTFRLAAAPSTASMLRVYLPGHVPTVAYRSRGAGSVLIVARRGARIEGTTRDSSGRPLAGVLVLAGGAPALSDDEGRYSITAAAEGSASVFAQKVDLVARRDGLRVKRGETAFANLVLSQSAAIAGTVVDERTRRPVAGARLSASEARVPWVIGGQSREATSDARGRFRIAGLSPREYVVRATHKDYSRAAIAGIRAGVSPPGAAAFALRRAATVTGRVADERGQPVAGARVTVVPGQGRRAFVQSVWGLPAKPSAATGPDGSFRLRGVTPSTALALEATKPGFVGARKDGIAVSGDGLKGVALTLPRGQQARGRVVDEAGQPIAGVELRLKRNEGSGSTGISAAGSPVAAVSDASGRLLAAALEPGDYDARFSREGYATKSTMLEVRGDGLTEWSPVVLRGSAPIAGIVRNQGGEPVAGAQVSGFDTRSGGSATAQSDAEGRFRLEGFAEGSPVNVNVAAPGYAWLHAAAAAPSPTLALVLSRSGTVRGRVEDAETKGALESFRVGFGPPRPLSVGSFTEREVQSADGTFEVGDVPPGKIEVRASAPGYLPAQVAPLDVGDGEIKEGIVLSLAKGKTVTGRVLDPRGIGVSNVIVGWREQGSADGRGMVYTSFGAFANVPNSTATDADGAFRYEGLPAGRLTFSALHSDFLEAAKTVDTATESAVELTLRNGASIGGQVLSGSSRDPVAGALVSLREQGAASAAWAGDETRTDASGRFAFSHLKEGRYQLSARGSTGRSPSREAVLAADQALEDVLLDISAGALVRGRVIGLPPGELSGIRIFGWASGFQAGTSTDERGEFLLRDAPAGVVRISATAGLSSGRSTTKALEVPEGASEASIEISFEGSSRLSGRVVRGEKGVVGAYVSASPDPPFAAAVRVSAQTDAEGRYEMNGLIDGTYRVYVNAENVFTSRTITVSGDSSADIVLQGMAVSGTVTDAASGEPLAGATVEASRSAASQASYGARGAADSRGYYALENLEAGDYRVTFRRDGYQQKTETITLSDSPTQLDAALPRGNGLTLRAADGLTGLPLASVFVLALTPARAAAFSGTVPLDASGQGEVAALAPGRYTLWIYSSGYAPRPVPALDIPSPPLPVSMTPGGTVEFRADAAITGGILDASGMPYVRGAGNLDGTVTLVPPVAPFEHFTPGSYRLLANGPDGVKGFPFTVEEGKTTVVQVR